MVDPKVQDTSPDALDKLKSILLNAEKERLSQLETEVHDLYSQLADKERLLETLDPIIADLLYKKIMESRDVMAEALAPVMGGALRAQIAEAKDDIADALYPVIGSAVRKSVSEAMKNLLQAINERIDNIVNKSFRLGKKIDSATLLRESIPFQLEQVFLIHRETGILLAHSSYDQGETGNEDIISGMLTAIREFSKTAFSNDENALYEIQYQNLQIIIEDGKYAYLAFVVSGNPGIKLQDIIKDFEHKLHLRFYKDLRAFQGETQPFKEADSLLSGFVQSVNEPLIQDALALKKDRHSSSKGLLVLITLMLIVIATFIFWPKSRDNSARLTQLIEHFQQRPGSFFTMKRLDNKVVLSGQIFEQDRKKLIQALDSLDFDVNNSQLFILPSQEILQKNLRSVERELGLATTMTVIIDSQKIDLVGTVPTREIQYSVARLFAQRSSLPLLWNHIKVQPISVLTNAELKKYTLYFAPNSTLLNAENRQLLSRLLLVLKNSNFKKLIIRGTADSDGSKIRNRKLALDRARMVRDYLIKNNFQKDKIQVRAQVFTSNKKAKGYLSLRRADFNIEE